MPNYKVVLATGFEMTVPADQWSRLGESAKKALKGEISPYQLVLVVRPSDGASVSGPLINVLQIVYATEV